MKRILIFSTAYLPLVGGAEIAVKEITDRLSATSANSANRADYKFDLICARIDKKLPRGEKIGEINVYRVGIGSNLDKIFFPITGFLKASFLNWKNKYDLIWAIMASHGGLAALFFKIFHPKVPFLLTLQEGDSVDYIKKKMKLIWPFKLIFKKADYIQVISNYLAGWGKKMGANCPIEVVPNGVDIKNFQFPIPNSRLNELKNRLNIKDDEKVIITVSRLVPKNGVDDLIEAMRYLNFPFKLLILGEGPLREKFESQAIHLGLRENVLFLGSISNSKIPDYLAVADVFVRPSVSEGLGNAFLEAMACGIPIIGTPVGGIPDFLINAETGLFCEIKNPKSIAEKIDLLLKDNELKEKLIVNGKKIAEEKYDWDYIAGRMADIFKRIKAIKILITTGIFSPDIGGPATMLEALVYSLRERGFEIKVLTYSDILSKDDWIFRVKRRKNFILRYLEYFGQMWKLAGWADVLYVTDTYSVGYFAYLMKKLLGKKYVVRFAGDSAWEIAVSRGWTKDYITDFQRGIYSPLIEKLKKRREKILKNANAVIAVSNFIAEIAEQIGVSRDKIRVIYNSIDFMEEEISNEKINQIKNQYGQGAKIIITACRLAPWKGVDGIIKILSQLQEKTGQVNLLVLGDGPELNNLKELAANLGLRDNAHFLGRVEHNEILNYFRAADLFILNTNYEGLSHTLLEAMKAGAPIITTKSGGNPEVIDDHKDGLVVHYDNQEELLAAAAKILNDFQFAQILAANAREKLKKFNWINTINQTTELLKEVHEENIIN